jgi:hypothetical protein
MPAPAQVPTEAQVLEVSAFNLFRFMTDTNVDHAAVWRRDPEVRKTWREKAKKFAALSAESQLKLRVTSAKKCLDFLDKVMIEPAHRAYTLE